MQRFDKAAAFYLLQHNIGVKMEKALATVTGWINEITGLLQSLVVLGVVVGILFNDPFGVIAGIGSLMGQIGDSGLAGLVALILVVVWYKK
jgi:hypothetical protein